MERIIGDKKKFAIGIEIQKFEPSIFGRSCIWINGNQLGDFDDLNILGPFIRSIMRLALNHEELWLEELNGLNCSEVFHVINPYYENPDEFYDLSIQQQSQYVRFDRFLFEFGENFDNLLIKPVVKDSVCKFIWLSNSINVEKSRKQLDIQCQDIEVVEIQSVYRELCNYIPIKYWPKFLRKL